MTSADWLINAFLILLYQHGDNVIGTTVTMSPSSYLSSMPTISASYSMDSYSESSYISMSSVSYSMDSSMTSSIDESSISVDISSMSSYETSASASSMVSSSANDESCVCSVVLVTDTVSASMESSEFTPTVSESLSIMTESLSVSASISSELSASISSDIISSSSSDMASSVSEVISSTMITPSASEVTSCVCANPWTSYGASMESSSSMADMSSDMSSLPSSQASSSVSVDTSLMTTIESSTMIMPSTSVLTSMEHSTMTMSSIPISVWTTPMESSSSIVSSSITTSVMPSIESSSMMMSSSLMTSEWTTPMESSSSIVSSSIATSVMTSVESSSMMMSSSLPVSVGTTPMESSSSIVSSSITTSVMTSIESSSMMMSSSLMTSEWTTPMESSSSLLSSSVLTSIEPSSTAVSSTPMVSSSTTVSSSLETSAWVTPMESSSSIVSSSITTSVMTSVESSSMMMSSSLMTSEWITPVESSSSIVSSSVLTSIESSSTIVPVVSSSVIVSSSVSTSVLTSMDSSSAVVSSTIPTSVLTSVTSVLTSIESSSAAAPALTTSILMQAYDSSTSLTFSSSLATPASSRTASSVYLLMNTSSVSPPTMINSSAHMPAITASSSVHSPVNATCLCPMLVAASTVQPSMAHSLVAGNSSMAPTQSINHLAHTCVCSMPSMLNHTLGPSIQPSSALPPIAMTSFWEPPREATIPSVYYKFFPMTDLVDVNALFPFLDMRDKEGIALVNISGEHGQFEYKTNADWIPLPHNISISSANAFTLYRNEKLRFITHPGSQGIAHFSYSFIGNATARFNNVTGSTVYQYFLLFKPRPTLNINVTHVNQTMDEDSDCNAMVRILDHLPPLLKPSMLTPLVTNISIPAIRLYWESFNRTVRDNLPSFAIKSLDRSNGLFYYGKNVSTKVLVPNLLSRAVVMLDTKFCFKPANNFYGETQAVIQVGITDRETRAFYSVNEVTLRIHVRGINDQPKLHISFVDAPPLPYNYSEIDTNGFYVSDIVSKPRRVGSSEKAMTDSDSTTLGIAIIAGQESSYGKFQYNCSGSWQDVNITNAKPPLSGSSLSAIFLGPTNGLRFIMTGNQFWNKLVAIRDTSFVFLAWDMSDSQACGLKHLNITTQKRFSYMSSFKNAAKFSQLRRGCDGREGTVAVFDGCNVCGGDNSTCKGCDGVLNSGATYNKCFNCTGGTTGNPANMSIDCAGTCLKSELDSCNVCQIRRYKVNNTDCNGVCFGSAIINKCTQCVGGNTGKAQNFGEDACGVCGGDNSTCLDCANVPRGDKKVDLCGNCLSPTDPTFNTLCDSILGRFTPNIGYYQGGMPIEVEGTSLENKTSVNCSFITGNTVVPAASSAFILFNGIQAKINTTTPANLPAGTYTINCTLVTTTMRSMKSAIGSLLVIRLSTITTSSIVPSVTKINTNTPIVVMGSGFVNSTELKCLFGSTHIPLQTTYLNSSAISCAVPPQAMSLVYNIYLSFVEYMRMQKLSLSEQLYISKDVPTMLTATFGSRLGSVQVQFNKPAQFINSSITCQHVFPHNYTDFGSRAVCKFVNDRTLKIYLIGNPTLDLGALVLDLSKLKAKSAAHTTYPAELLQSQMIVRPATLVAPRLLIIGPKVVGSCDKIKLFAKIVGGNIGRVRFSWYVTWAASNQNACPNATKLNMLNTTMNNLSGHTRKFTLFDALFIDNSLTFTVIATNFLGEQTIRTITVLRENKELPQVTLSATSLTRMVAQDIYIRAKAKLSDCIDRDSFAAKLSFQWIITPSVGITLDVTNQPQLKIPKGTLIGGKTYSATIVVAMQQDSTLSVTQSVTITTLSSALIPRIKGVQAIGSTDILRLSGSNSFDPDQVSTAPSYSWEVTNEDLSALIINGSRVMLPSTVDLVLNVQNYLPSGKSYIFTMNYRVNQREASITHKVKVIPGDPPSVVFRSMSDNINPSSKIKMTAVITSLTSGTYEWSSVVVDSSESDLPYSTTLLTSNEVITPVTGTFGQYATVDLLFKRNALEGNAYYRFRLTATNLDAESSAIIDFKTNGAPTPGVITASPATGFALNTTFTMTASEGWSDPDEDDLFFGFGYKFTAPDGTINLMLYISASDDSYSTTLPPGNITLLVYCTDIYGAYSYAETEVTVEQAPISDNLISNLESAMLDAADSGNMDALLGGSITLMNSMGSEEEGATVSPALVQFQQSAADSVCNLASSGALQNSEEKDRAINGLGSLTTGGSANFDMTLKSKIIDSLNSIIGIGGGGARRRRRAIGSGVEEKTPTQVEDSLAPYSNLIDPTAYDTNSQNSKAQLIEALNSLTPSMCKGFAVGEPAGLAKSALVVVQTLNKDFGDVDTANISLGCSDCPTYMKVPDYVVLGSSLKSSYGSYSCDTGEICTGACVSSWQMSADLISSSYNASLLSGVLMVKLWNPFTFADLAVTNVPSGVVVQQAVTVTTNKTYVCQTWDAVASAWTEDGVETSDVADLGYATYVTCNMTVLSYLAVFEGPEITVTSTAITSTAVNTTSEASNTTSSTNTTGSANTTSSTNTSSITTTTIATTTNLPTTTTTTLAPANYPQNVSFSFPFNVTVCRSLVAANGAESFSASIASQVASKANVRSQDLQQFNATCGSINVAFLVVKGNLTVEAAVARIQSTVSSNQMIIVVDGNNVTGDPNSFVAVINYPSYATSPPTTPLPKAKTGLSGGAIAGIVIGAVAFIVIVVLIVFYSTSNYQCIRRGTRKNVVEPDDDNGLELQGRENRAYTDNP